MIHSGQVVDADPELGPVGEDLAVAAVGDELLRELGHLLVQVVQDHVDDGSALLSLGGDGVQWVGSRMN